MRFSIMYWNQSWRVTIYEVGFDTYCFSRYKLAEALEGIEWRKANPRAAS